MRLCNSNPKPLKRYDGDQIVLIDEDFNIKGFNDPHKSKARWAQLQIRSVQHTGTGFIDDMLSKAGWKVRTTHYTESTVKDRGLIISPIRNPYDCYVTWISRKRTEDFFQTWRWFNEMYLENPDLIVVPIDTEDREDHLQNLCKKLKCHIVTNWKPVNSEPREDVKPINLDEIFKLDVVRKYYGEYS